MDTTVLIILILFGIILVLLGIIVYFLKNPVTSKKSSNKSVAKKPAVKKPAAKSSSVKKSSTKISTQKKSAGKIPAGKNPEASSSASKTDEVSKPAAKKVSQKRSPAKSGVKKNGLSDVGFECAPGFEEYDVIWQSQSQSQSQPQSQSHSQSQSKSTLQSNLPWSEYRGKWPDVSELDSLSEKKAKEVYLQLTAYSKGAEFEDDVASFLSGNKIRGYHRVLSGVYIPTGEDTFTEIDCLMVHVSGVYVFECKNYSGLVTGTSSMKMWNVSYDSGNKSTLYNPVQQNMGHIRALEKFVSKPSPVFVSKIVFGDEALIKVPASLARTVVSFSALKQDFTRELESCTRLYSSAEVDKITSVLQKGCEVSYRDRLKHIVRLSQEDKDRSSGEAADFDSYFR